MGAILDSVVNSIELINPRLAFILSFTIFFIYLFLTFFIRIKGVTWKTGGKTLIVKKINIKIQLFFVGMLLLIWVPVFIGNNQNSNSENQNDIVWHEGDKSLRIGILPFNEVCTYNSRSFDVGYVIADRLRKLIGSNKIRGEVKYLENIKVDKNFDKYDAKKILKDYHLDQLVFGSHISENCHQSNGYCINYITSDSLKVPFRKNSVYGEWKQATLEELKSGFIQEELDAIIYWLAALNYFYSDQKRYKTIEYLNILENNYNVKSVDVFNLRGLAYLLEQKDTLAFKDFTKSLEVGPRYADILYQRGSLSAKLFSDLNGAIKDYNESLSQDPANELVYYLRGQLHFELNQFDLTIRDMKKHHELSPNDYSSYYYLASSYMGKNEYKLAKKYALEGIRNCDRDMIGYCHLALAQIIFNSNLGSRDSMIYNFDKAAEFQQDLVPTIEYYKKRLSGNSVDDAQEVLKENGLMKNFKKLKPD